ncbi:hypothetical protein J6590_104688 [Homalodisca vitripennis]|nr:hypothetical protein J6590_104688 [Homalodisca vitripennis]
MGDGICRAWPLKVRRSKTGYGRYVWLGVWEVVGQCRTPVGAIRYAGAGVKTLRYSKRRNITGPRHNLKLRSRNVPIIAQIKLHYAT